MNEREAIVKVLTTNAMWAGLEPYPDPDTIMGALSDLGFVIVPAPKEVDSSGGDICLRYDATEENKVMARRAAVAMF